MHTKPTKLRRIVAACAVFLPLAFLGACRGLVNGSGVTPGNLQSIQHVVFMLQENRTFDSYFGMLNTYRQANGFTLSEDGKTYSVDGIDGGQLVNSDDDCVVLNLSGQKRARCRRYEFSVARKLWRCESFRLQYENFISDGRLLCRGFAKPGS